MKKIKGFTLIECIVAMAVLVIASITMAQIYGSVARINRENALVNTSLSNQMAYVEKYTESEAVKVDYTAAGGASSKSNATPPHQVGDDTKASKPYVQVTKDGSTESYSYPVDVYTLLSRDNEDRNSTDSNFGAQYDAELNETVGGTTQESDYNLRYRYVQGHPAS